MSFNSPRKLFLKRIFHPMLTFVLSSLVALVVIESGSALVGQESDRGDEIQSTIERLQRELETLQSNRAEAASTAPSLFDARGRAVESGQLSSNSGSESIVTLDSSPVDSDPLQLSAPLPFDSVAPGFIPVPGTSIDPTDADPTLASRSQPTELPNMSPSMRAPVRNPYQSSQPYYRPPYSSHGSKYYGSAPSKNDDWGFRYEVDYRQPYYSHSYYVPPSCAAFCPIR